MKTKKPSYFNLPTLPEHFRRVIANYNSGKYGVILKNERIFRLFLINRRIERKNVFSFFQRICKDAYKLHQTTIVKKGINIKLFKLSPTITKLQVGYCHFVMHPLNRDATRLISLKRNMYLLYGTNKQQVNQEAHSLINYRKMNIYTGKGFKFKKEKIRRKEGKKQQV
jgi:hypothetical protein